VEELWLVFEAVAGFLRGDTTCHAVGSGLGVVVFESGLDDEASGR
jgi:hypothetical protein